MQLLMPCFVCGGRRCAPPPRCLGLIVWGFSTAKFVGYDGRRPECVWQSDVPKVRHLGTDCANTATSNKLSTMLWQLILTSAATLVAGAEIQDEVKKATTIESGSKYCPAPGIGTACPSSGFAWQYKCCGDLLTDCCFHLQNWALILLIIVGIILIASFVLSLIRFLCCRR
uniref:Uncharacterized protein n=1 Tax=Panagrellus redivivus TaxID=6233 RepID=A0A7E4VMQ6_PANRE